MIYLVKMAFRNVFRNFRRSMLTGLSIVFAVAIIVFMWAFAKGEVKGIFDVYIRFQSGNIRVMNRDYVKREKMLSLSYSIPDYNSVLKMIEKVKDVREATGRIKFGVLLDYKGSTKQTLGIGVDPKKEESILGISQKMVAGRMIASGAQETNIGSTMANELGLKLNDTLTVVTQTAYGSFSAKNLKIVGIFSYGSPMVDRKTFFMPLDVAQDLLDMAGSVTEIYVLVKDQEKARTVAKEIEKNLDKKYIAKAWQDQGPIYMWVKLADYIYMVIFAIVLLLSAFTILNTMFMAVLERTREIGMMKAMGMKNRQLIGVILLEATVLGALASAIGAAIGTAIMYYMSVKGLDFTTTVSKMDFPTPNIYYCDFSWTYILTGFIIGVLFSILASILPALRAAEMQPTEALHEI